MPEISDKEFKIFQDITLRLLGMKLQEHKKALVISRLSSRVKELNLDSFMAYINYLDSSTEANKEIVNFINKITTNETSFFREPQHFEFLTKKFFPELVKRAEGGGIPNIRIWSSACSSGEEPYSIAITALEYFKNINSVNFKILATDINTDVLDHAKKGCYKKDDVLKKLSKNLNSSEFIDF